MALACAATAALVAPAVAAPAQAQTSTQAQARPLNPTAALKKAFVPGRGVRFTSSGKIDVGGIATVKSSAKGSLAFGRSGVTGSDVTARTDYGALLQEDVEGANKPTRTITVGRAAYVTGGVFSSLFPEGKKWLRMPGKNSANPLGSNGEFINPLDARTLKTVLATTKAKGRGGVVNGARTTLYRGAITLKQLAQLDPSLKKSLTASDAKSVVNWKMWVGGDQLVRKLQTSLTLKLRYKKTTMEVDTSNVISFVGWGSRVTVKAPPKSQVASLGDLLGSIPDMPDTINLGD